MPKIFPIPALRDNYIWAIHDPRGATGDVVLVDPGEPGAILSWLERVHARPRAILVTHHHADHTGALAALCQRWQVPVYGPAREAIAGVTQAVDEGDVVAVAELGLRFEVLATPGHTLGHVCYLGHGALFCGDTLFSCGCGRLFEGTPAQLHASLQRLASLPPATAVHCAHEYTLPNIAFARAVEPDNAALAARHHAARAARKAGQATLPSTIGDELATNPFLRCHHASVLDAITQHSGEAPATAVAAFAALRRWKDGY